MTDTLTVVVHPTLEGEIRTMAARWKWYRSQHIRRWERRYNKPYPYPQVEIGEWSGIKFIA